MSTTRTEIVHAYRTLRKTLQRAVLDEPRARRTAWKQLRAAFREPGAAFDERGVRHTTWFLQCAARERGMEHRILKNLLRVQADRDAAARGWKSVLHNVKTDNLLDHEKKTKYRHYDMTVAMLNKTLGLCLR